MKFHEERALRKAVIDVANIPFNPLRVFQPTNKIAHAWECAEAVGLFDDDAALNTDGAELAKDPGSELWTIVIRFGQQADMRSFEGETAPIALCKAITWLGEYRKKHA